MRREPEYFAERQDDLVLIHIAKKLRDALRLEEVLTAAAVDYLVEPDKYRGGVIFQTERVGAFFYVLPETVTAARGALETHGFKVYETLGEIGRD